MCSYFGVLPAEAMTVPSNRHYRQSQATDSRKLQTVPNYRQSQATDSRKLRTATSYGQPQATDSRKQTVASYRQSQTDSRKQQTVTSYRQSQATDSHKLQTDSPKLQTVTSNRLSQATCSSIHSPLEAMGSVSLLLTQCSWRGLICTALSAFRTSSPMEVGRQRRESAKTRWWKGGAIVKGIHLL